MIETDRLTSLRVQPEEQLMERVIRPHCLAEYVGQKPVCEQMALFMQAAKNRNEALEHVLIFGPPGLGKTTMAQVIASEMGGALKQTSGPIMGRPADLAAILTNLQAKDVLFIDEIHRLDPVVEEILYPAMEDGRIDILIGEGSSARSIQLELPDFTLVGATTRAGLLTAPLRDRFGIVQRLEFYTDQELMQIIRRSADILKLNLDDSGAREIARRSRGTPRIANRLLRRVRDYAEVKANGLINLTIANEALTLLNIDQAGFDRLDQKLLQTIIQDFEGGPVGIDNLSAAIGEESGTIEEVLEPFLIQQGFLRRTPRGRIVTERSYHHFKLPYTPYEPEGG